MKMKITRVVALALAALMAVSLTACGGKDDDGAETTAAIVDEIDVQDAIPTEEAAETTAAEDSEIETDAALTEQTAAETEAPAPDESTTEATTATTTAAPETTTAAPETTTEAKKAPTDKAEILKIYNDATAKVVNNKIAYKKTRETKEGIYDAGVALKAVKNIVYGFMGIGAENVKTYDANKNDGNYSKYLTASTLTPNDIESATATLNDDGSYDITIKVKPGSSYIDGGNGEKLNAPLDKTGIAAGRDDKGYWDHKTAQVVYDAIKDVAGSAVVDEKYNNATVKAHIDPNGNLTKLDVTYDIDFNISKVYGSSGHATGTTMVSYKDFKW